MARNILRADKNNERSPTPDLDKKTESKTSSTFDLKPRSLIQFVGAEKKITSFELKMVENYIFKSLFQKYKCDIKKFEKFMACILQHFIQLSHSAQESNETRNKPPFDLELEIEAYLFKNLSFLKKEVITEAIRKNGLISFLMIIIQNHLEKENMGGNFMTKRIRYNQKIVFCSNEKNGCSYKGKFADFLIHEKDDCPFEKISCPFLNCKVRELRKDMKSHEIVCPFKVIYYKKNYNF